MAFNTYVSLYFGLPSSPFPYSVCQSSLLLFSIILNFCDQGGGDGVNEKTSAATQTPFQNGGKVTSVNNEKDSVLMRRKVTLISEDEIVSSPRITKLEK